MIDLLAMVDYWQGALRLRDWRIAVRFVPDLCLPDGSIVHALCSPLVDNRTASIEIRDPSTPAPGMSGDAWVEEAVIHELLHLHFAAFGTREPAAVAAEEQAVWAIAESLIKARGTPQEETLARAMRAALAKASAPSRRQQKRRNAVDEKDDKAADAGGGDGSALLDIIANNDAAGALEWVKAHAKKLIDSGIAGPADEPASDMPAATQEGPPMAAADETQAPGQPARAARLAPHERAARAASQSMTTNAIRFAIHTAREVDKVTLPPSVERDVLACGTIEEANKLIKTARACSAQSSGVRAAVASKAAELGATDLSGLGPQEIAAYETMKKNNPEGAELYAKNAKAVATRRAAMAGKN